VAVVSIKLRDVDNLKMSRYMSRKYKQKSTDRLNHDKPRKMQLTAAERAKAFKDGRGAERESASQPSTGNDITTANLLMKLHVDIDIDADEAMSPVGMQLR
jgi:hypothetical protein